MLKQLKNLLKNEIDPAFAKRAEFIFKEIRKRKPKRILDAGCGRGFYVYALSMLSFPKEICGIDIKEEYLKVAKQNCIDKRVQLQQTSIYNLPFPDEYFDCVISSEILEHLKDDGKALQELKRVIRKNGILLITVPNYNFPFLWDPINWILMRIFNTHINKNIWWLAGIWADHERLYTKKQLLSIIDKYFKIHKANVLTHWCWPFTHFILYGIGKNLVERLGCNTFNRFNVKENRKLSQLLAKFFALPTSLDSVLKTKSGVNIAVLAQK